MGSLGRNCFYVYVSFLHLPYHYFPSLSPFCLFSIYIICLYMYLLQIKHAFVEPWG
ncbi:hypothetical protein Fmac_023207 [Flemingia macrophylla]|uniref:Uncharacterized protein n=1 Tax=Flemingia macrophylla TaxID=520843 RepID=A0ABD1LKU2_9FABA